MSRNGKVIVAMSGGVDSSVTAALLKEQGYDPVGVFMWVGPAGAGPAPEDAPLPSAPPDAPPAAKQGCCSIGDACDARAIAQRLEIPFYTLNLRQDFEQIIAYFVDEYAHARTPNPCVMCNTHVKFGRLLAYADMVGAEFVATGHYARVLRDTGDGPALARSSNRSKDQSYALFGIRRENLPRCLFPVGEVTDKATVREIATRLGLGVHDKPDSQEICFVPNNDYKQLVRERRPATGQPGDVVDVAGNVVGRHDGIVNYTIGQRRGLRIAMGTPIYVTHLDAERNTVTVGPRAALQSGGLVARRMNWLTDAPPTGAWEPATIQIRYNHDGAAGRFRVDEGGAIEATFDTPQAAVTPGQAAVLYRDDELVIGGGWIDAAVSTQDAHI